MLPCAVSFGPFFFLLATQAILPPPPQINKAFKKGKFLDSMESVGADKTVFFSDERRID